MSEAGTTTRECPLCREEIHADAVRCKHCLGVVAAARPGHGGTCPLCREQIHPGALRCRHCKADLVPTRTSRGCGGSRRTRPPGRRRYDHSLRRLPGARDGAPVAHGPVIHGTCPEWVEEEDGWFGILVDWDDESCTYEQY